ncbi:helix-turn-helix domain-containing protein [Ornithinimicrobium sp. Arc0846-15]|nr:helix-turn-helix domain-containing protein [Ornithinimicrobium laminariae]
MREDISADQEEPSTRAQVLQALKDAGGPLTILDLAQRLEVHPNTIRFHLTRLVEQAQAERVSEPHQVRGRPPQLFQIAPGMDPTGPRHYQALAAAFVHSVAAGPDPGAQALEVGRAWGRELASSPLTPTPKEPVEALVRMLNELGFAPEWDRNVPNSQIELRHCPFLELATEQPEVVCPLHLGLMQGAVQTWQAPVDVDRLEPFVTPDRCLAHLSAATR